MAYRFGLKRSVRLPVPVVVVGNVQVGGTGKTPLTRYLIDELRARGWNPAVVSRGYGGTAEGARPVTPDSDAAEVGDEPVLLASHGCPVWIGRDRVATAQALLAAHPDVDLLLCDDGLQHYRLARDLEIAVVDTARADLPNRHLLPAGPLREPWGRLKQVDAVVVHGEHAPPVSISRTYRLRLAARDFYRVSHPAEHRAPADFQGLRLAAAAGIGQPARFGRTLSALGLDAPLTAFPDHHRYSPSDLAFPGVDAVLITEKDAVKCRGWNDDKLWALCVAAELEPDLSAFINQQLEHIPRSRRG